METESSSIPNHRIFKITLDFEVIFYRENK